MRAEHTIPVALLFALACQGESKPLGRPDPSTGDASHPDAAIGDAGARDGGPRDAGPSAGFEYLVLERVPWGSRRTRYMRTTHLLGEASPNVEVEIFDSDDPAAAPIATGAADEDGRLDVTVPDTIVDAFVSAGGGARVPVVDERWVATFGPGTNPHSAYFTPAPFSSRRLHAAIRDRVALDDRAALARVDDDALSAVGEPIFEFESAGPDPGAFIASAFAYDSARRRLFLFGGVNGAPRRGSDETWVHDGTRWSRLDTEGLHPPPRQNAAMAYNPITERIVLVGGQSGSVRLDDTWIHDGTQWRELHTAKTPCRGDGPVATFDAARSRIALFAPGCGHLELVGDTWVERPTDLDVSAVFELAYDRDAEELVLLGLGGRGLTTYSYDGVWTAWSAATPGATGLTFDAASDRLILCADDTVYERGPGTRTWVERPVVGPRPRCGVNAVYDATNERPLHVVPSSNTLELWTTDGAAWFRLTEDGPSPFPRVGHALVYDAGRDRVVLFGGERPSQRTAAAIDDHWEWDGARWSRREVVVPSPSNNQVTYDEALGEILVVDAAGATHGFDGSTWALRTTAGPSPRDGAGMTHDILGQRTLLYGGQGSGADELWSYANGAWTEVVTTGTVAPGAVPVPLLAYAPSGDVYLVPRDTNAPNHLWRLRTGQWTDLGPLPADVGFVSAVTYDEARDALWLYRARPSGANSQQVFVYANGAWSAAPNEGLRPDGAVDVAATYHRQRAEVVFGGSRDASDLFTWDGARWSEVTPRRAPNNAAIPAFAYAPDGTTMLHTGRTPIDGDDRRTWTLGPDGWAHHANAVAPPAGVALTYDEGAGRFVGFGGRTLGAVFEDALWTFLSGAWLRAAPLTPRPPGRAGATLAYDPSRGVTLLFGGIDGSGPRIDTWSFDGAWTARGDLPAPDVLGAAFDPIRGAVVALIDDGALAVPYAFDGATWTRISTTGVAPRTGAAASFAYDATRGRFVVLDTTPGAYGSLAELAPDGAWTSDPLRIDTAPPSTTYAVTPRPDDSMLYFPLDSLDANASFDRPRRLRPRADERPSFVATFASSLPEGATIHSVEFDVFAGARGYGVTVPGTGAPEPGYILSGYDFELGAWSDIGETDHDLDETDQHLQNIRLARAAQLVGPDGSVHVGVRARVGRGNGPGPAALRVNYVEVAILTRRAP